MKLIAGLGNPGRQYDGTRHNMGFRVIDELSRRFRIALSLGRFGGELGLGAIDGQRVALLKPQTFMNLSGDSVAPAARFYKVEPEDLIVVHDELDLPLGRLQLKRGGGSGGHNGISSIIERLGGEEFVRVRIGIGKPEEKERVIGHVLSGFSRSEGELARQIADRAAGAIQTILAEGLPKAMTEYNRR